MSVTKQEWEAAVDKAFAIQLSQYGVDPKRQAVSLIDANDGKRVVGHYGETHLCAALLLRSRRMGVPSYKEKALELFEGVLAHWDFDAKFRQAHNDFNNFALALFYEELRAQGEDKLAERAMKRLLTSKDSLNKTVNWLPMRVYARLLCYEYSNDPKFLQIAVDALEVVKSAQYADGMFDDLLPRGMSFNLQYCVSTAAVLRLAARRFAAFSDRLPAIDLASTARALYGAIFPDGDVDYMGRGCNQIFAWGPWLYFAENFVEPELKERAFQFLAERFPTALDARSLMLNAYPGKDRALWWDYHHFSVYLSHLLLWNELAARAAEDASERVEAVPPSDSGLRVYRTGSAFASFFAGREHYLVEKGPALVGLWTKKYGAVFKCGHGPAAKMFSERNFNPLTAYFDHFGLIELTERPRRIKVPFARRLCAKLTSRANSLTVKPLFFEFSAGARDGALELRLQARKRGRGGERRFVFPTFSREAAENAVLYAGAKESALRYLGTVPSQYGEIFLYMSDAADADEWRLIVR